jgi:hypothetical protein
MKSLQLGDKVTEIEKEFHDREQQCRTIALQLGELDSGILAIALVGSCARGALAPEDTDFLVLVDSPGLINRLEERFNDRFRDSATRYSFIYYTRDNLESLLAHRSPNTRQVHFARFLTRLLRHLPVVKKFLIWLLGPRKTHLQMREVLPQSFQTAIPLYDPGRVLAGFQVSQAEQLCDVLPHWEREFYSPYGFHKLVQGYLSGQADIATVQSILGACDIDAQDYVERLASYYDSLRDDSRAKRCRAIFNSNISHVTDVTDPIAR